MKKKPDVHNDLSHLAKCLYSLYAGWNRENVIIVPFFTLHLCIAFKIGCVCACAYGWCVQHKIHSMIMQKNNKKEIPNSNSCIWWNEKRPMKKKRTHTQSNNHTYLLEEKKLRENIEKNFWWCAMHMCVCLCMPVYV